MLKIRRTTPAELGYSMPPEWAMHRATWFSWPRPDGISFPGRYKSIPPTLADLMREVALRERVEVNVPSAEYEDKVRRELAANGCPADNIFYHHNATNECWCRDHGPAFLVRSRGKRKDIAIVDWEFNAWGKKYPSYDDDDRVPRRIAEELGLPLFRPGIVMEGGSVDFNGAGTVMTTESCLLNPNRNPGLSRRQVERYLKRFYGQKHVIWLKAGIAGDDTDGHIDDLARFVDPHTVVIGIEDDPGDANYQVLQQNLQFLRTLRDQAGRPFRIIELPMPGVVEHRGHRLPATYVNFYFVNGAVLMPTYGNRAADRKAAEILGRCLPDRQIVGIDCTDLIWGLGAIHCLTQQQPAV